MYFPTMIRIADEITTSGIMIGRNLLSEPGYIMLQKDTRIVRCVKLIIMPRKISGIDLNKDSFIPIPQIHSLQL